MKISYNVINGCLVLAQFFFLSHLMMVRKKMV